VWTTAYSDGVADARFSAEKNAATRLTGSGFVAARSVILDGCVAAHASCRVTRVVGARIRVVTVDASAEPLAEAGLASAGKSIEVALGVVGDRRVDAHAKGKAAHVLGALVVVVAVNTFAEVGAASAAAAHATVTANAAAAHAAFTANAFTAHAAGSAIATVTSDAAVTAASTRALGLTAPDHRHDAKRQHANESE
jgi:hypothetical protein